MSIQTIANILISSLLIMIIFGALDCSPDKTSNLNVSVRALENGVCVFLHFLTSKAGVSDSGEG